MAPRLFAILFTSGRSPRASTFITPLGKLAVSNRSLFGIIPIPPALLFLYHPSSPPAVIKKQKKSVQGNAVNKTIISTVSRVISPNVIFQSSLTLLVFLSLKISLFASSNNLQVSKSILYTFPTLILSKASSILLIRSSS